MPCGVTISGLFARRVLTARVPPGYGRGGPEGANYTLDGTMTVWGFTYMAIQVQGDTVVVTSMVDLVRVGARGSKVQFVAPKPSPKASAARRPAKSATRTSAKTAAKPAP